MRLSLTAAALVALAAAPSAQTQYADSAGAYVGVHRLSNEFETGFGVGASFGRRLSNGLDYGVQFDVSQSGSVDRERSVRSSSSVTVGPTLGYTRGVGAGVLGRVSAAVLYGTGAATFQGARLRDQQGETPEYVTVSGQSLSGSVSATASRPVSVYGSLRVQPTVGVLAEGQRRLSFETDVVGLDPSTPRLRTAVLLGLPVSLRVSGRDVTFEPGVTIPVSGDRGRYLQGGGGLRVNF